MKEKTEELISALEAMDVTELDDKDLDAVSGGVELDSAGCTNGNCNGCAPGTKDPNGCTNANCEGGAT